MRNAARVAPQVPARKLFRPQFQSALHSAPAYACKLFRRLNLAAFCARLFPMRAKTRQDPRYQVLGRAICQEISALPGNLIDISARGCKIFYSVPVSIHLEDDYTLTIQVADNSTGDLTLICHPAWVNEDSGQTFLGMTILRSPDSEQLRAFVESLKSKNESDQDNKSQIVDSQCQFI